MIKKFIFENILIFCFLDYVKIFTVFMVCFQVRIFLQIIHFPQQNNKMRTRTMTSIDSYQHTHAARYVPTLQSKQVGINSKIVLPLVNEYMSLNHHIKWFRSYGSRSQYLSHIDNYKTYQCSPLDFNCKIQAIVEYPIGFKCSKSSLPYEIRIVKPQRSSVKEKYQYQVVQLSQNLNFKPQTYQGVRIPIKIVFDLAYQTIKQGSLYIQDKIIFKARQHYELTIQEILSIYVSDGNALQITIPLIPQDKFHKKLFVEKQPHRFRSTPVKIMFFNYEAFGSALLLINKLKANTSFYKEKLQSSRFQKPDVYLSFLGEKTSSQGYKKYMKSLFSKPSNISTDILNITSPSYSQNPQIMSLRITPNQPFKALNNFNSYNLKGSELIQRTIQKNSNIVSSEKDNIGTDENSFNFMEDFDELFQDQKEQRQLCLNSSFDELQKKNQPFADMRIIRQIQDRKKQQNNKETESKQIIEKMKSTKEQINKLELCNAKLKNEIGIMKNLQKQPNISVNELQAMVNSMKRYELKLRKQIALGKEIEQHKSEINMIALNNFQLEVEAKQ